MVIHICFLLKKIFLISFISQLAYFHQNDMVQYLLFSLNLYLPHILTWTIKYPLLRDFFISCIVLYVTKQLSWANYKIDWIWICIAKKLFCVPLGLAYSKIKKSVKKPFSKLMNRNVARAYVSTRFVVQQSSELQPVMMASFECPFIL